MSRDEGLGIIALVPDYWDGIVTVRHQVVRRLAAHFKVEWVEPALNWRDFVAPTAHRFLAGDSWNEPVPSLEVLNTGWRHPQFYRPTWLADATVRSRLVLARKRLLARGAKRIALYLWRDEFANALDLIPHDFSCYHIDDEYTFSDVEIPTSPRETRLLQRVDLAIVHSPALFKKKGTINENTALIPNGVDYDLYSTPLDEPADLAAIPHPRVGYTGVIKKQLDFGLLVRLATARPDWNFVLVGPITNIVGKEAEVATLEGMANVHFIGAKPAGHLPRYVQHFDVCLMCYQLTDYTKYIYPLKLHEYLATGRPTVASAIGALATFKDVVSIAKNDAEWLAAIEQGIAEGPNDRVSRAQRQSVAREHDWHTLVERIARLFSDDSANRDRRQCVVQPS